MKTIYFDSSRQMFKGGLSLFNEDKKILSLSRLNV